MLVDDLQLTLRIWRRMLPSTAILIVTLAVCIGTAASVGSIVHEVLLRPLPYRDPDRLVMVWNRWTRPERVHVPLAAGDLLDLRERSQLFEDFAAIRPMEQTLIEDGQRAEQVSAALVSANFFSLLGVKPALGRDFVSEDEFLPPPGAGMRPDVAFPLTALIITDGYWRTRFGADPSVVGRSIRFGFWPMVVVGVLPRDFELLLPAETRIAEDVAAFRPYFTRRNARDNPVTRIVGRLKPGVSIEHARGELSVIGDQLTREHAGYAEVVKSVEAFPLHTAVVKGARPLVLLLVGAVILMMLIGCGNVGHLVLVRALSRQHEFSIRRTLGCTRYRLARLLLTEHAALIGISLAGGLVLAHYGLDLLQRLMPANLPRFRDLHINYWAAGIAVLCTMVAVALFGALPSVRGWWSTGSLVVPGVGAGMSPFATRVRRASIAAEIALAVILLVGGALLLQTLIALQRVKPGYDVQQVVTFDIFPTTTRYMNVANLVTLQERLIQAVESLQNVQSVAIGSPLPLRGGGWTGTVFPATATAGVSTAFRAASSRYFETLRIRILGGRQFDRGEAPSSIIVDERFARSLWPRGNAIGQALLIQPGPERPPVAAHVVGVAASARYDSLREPDLPTVYVPVAGTSPFSLSFAVRSSSEVTGLAEQIQEQLSRLDPEVPAGRFRLLQSYLDEQLASSRFAGQLTAAFAVAALALALLGLYGVMAFSVRQRSREMAVRMALGATESTVRRLILSDAAGMTGFGLVLGLTAAALASHIGRSLLFDIAPVDLGTYAMVTGVILLAALGACAVPTLQAGRIQAAAVLKCE